MAKPLAYVPAPPPMPTPEEAARAELDTLITALHERGVLRLLNGLLASGPEVATVAMGQLESPTGERAVRNAVVLGTAATRIDPDRLNTVVTALARGIDAAADGLTAPPPGTASVLKALNDPAVRRGFGALIALVRAFGEEPTRIPQEEAT